jgi:hypothetical protein
VEHGCGALDGASPLLIIAGAGSGKTNTLANRVAHLTRCRSKTLASCPWAPNARR